MKSLADFFYMGGYAFYVWTSYGIVLVVLVANFLLPMMRVRRLHDSLKKQFEATPGERA